jgi:hypothetical protein
MNGPVVFWISITAAVIFSVTLTWQAHQIVVTARLYKGVALADIKITLRYTLRGRNAINVLLPILSIMIFGIVLPLGHVSYAKIVLLPVVLFHVLTLALHSTPPSVLLLASSRWESIRLFNLIERGIHPYRVVALLEPSLVERTRHSLFHWDSFALDNLRIFGLSDWRAAVQCISACVPLVVLDTRLPSPAVVEETRLMLGALFREKTLFLLADDGTAPSIAAAQPGRSLVRLNTACSAEVIDKLRSMGLSQTISPNEVPLLDKLSYSRNSKQLAKGMMAVAHAGGQFHSALEAAERVRGRTPFVTAARSLEARLNGNPGDGALEVFAQLDDDSACVDSFLNRWKDISEPEYQEAVTRVVAVHAALCNLRRMVDLAPPSFLQQDKIVLKRVRDYGQSD